MEKGDLIDYGEEKGGERRNLWEMEKMDLMAYGEGKVVENGEGRFDGIWRGKGRGSGKRRESRLDGIW